MNTSPDVQGLQLTLRVIWKRPSFRDRSAGVGAAFQVASLSAMRHARAPCLQWLASNESWPVRSIRLWYRYRPERMGLWGGKGWAFLQVTMGFDAGSGTMQVRIHG